MILKSHYVVPIDRPVIENGAVDVRDGKIASVGTAHELAGGPAFDCGDAVILPGLVNAHTHLELSLQAGKVTPHNDLVEWLTRLMAGMPDDADKEEQVRDAVLRGVELSVSSGVTTLGDITRFPSCARAVLVDSGLHVVSFGEVIAVGRRRELLGPRLGAGPGLQPPHPPLGQPAR